MSYQNYASSGLGNPSSGFGGRARGVNNLKRLSVALPPKVNSISEDQVDNPTPRTSRSHLLAGLRTAPKSANGPASAPYYQTQHQMTGSAPNQWSDSRYSTYNQAVPYTAVGTSFGQNRFVANAGQQTYALPEQVLAPPSFYGREDEIDPTYFEQLQLTGLYLQQRQQQLQQQLANITAAANQFQGMSLNTKTMQQQQQLPMMQSIGRNTMYGQQQQTQSPIEVPGQPGLYLVYDNTTGQYQYVQDTGAQKAPSSFQQSQPAYNLSTASSATYDASLPMFRAEISPPPVEHASASNSRSITPPKKAGSPPSVLEHVEPLPPPSATAFRRGHKKATSLAISTGNSAADGPKTSSAATFASARTVVPAGPMTGTFGPGNARAGEHPIRQPRGPPSLEELVALPTTKHEGSKNFATRQRRRALNSLMRAGSVRRSFNNVDSPISESELSFQLSEDDDSPIRKQSPIGSERSVNRGSQSSLEGLGTGSAVTTPASEVDGNIFDMRSFVKGLPPHVQQSQERRKMMLGVLNAAEKRKSFS